MAGTLKTFAGLRDREEGRLIAGRYILRERLGVGSSAKVYSALDLALQRDVALKLLNMSGDVQEIHARFRSEREALQQLAGAPHVVSLYDHGEDNGQPFLVLERVSGSVLSHVLAVLSKSRTRIPMQLQNVLRWFDQICLAIAAAHCRGVIHRDIKPSNVMLAHPDQHEEIKVFDFGVARSPNHPDEGCSGPLGTLGYMSPEQPQRRGSELTPASDVFSLGVLLVEMLSPSARAQSDVESVACLAMYAPGSLRPFLRNLRTDIPDALWEAVARALETQPEARYKDAEAFRQAVRSGFESAARN